MPEATREHGGAIETKPGRRVSAGVTTGEMFLSPRVVDRHAFDEYVRLLRAEVRDAAQESELLARRAEAGAVVLDQLERFIGENAGEIERAAEILSGMDIRTARARELLDEIERRSSGLDRISRDAERSLEERAEAFQSRLRSIVDTAMDRFEETEDQLGARSASMRRELTERLETLRTRGEEIVSRLESRTEGFHTESEADLARVEARLQSLHEPARELLSRIESKTASLSAQGAAYTDQIVKAGDAALRSITHGATEAREHEAALSAALAKATAELAELEQISSESRRSIEQDSSERVARASDDLAAMVSRSIREIGEATERARAAIYAASEESVSVSVGASVDAAARAKDIVRSVEGDIDRLGARVTTEIAAAEEVLQSSELRAVLDRCEHAEARAAAAATRCGQLTAQTGVAEATLAEAILDAADTIDGLAERSARIASTGADEVERLEARLESCRGPLDETAALMDSITADTDDAGGVEAGLIARLVERVRAQVASERDTELETMSAALVSLTERVMAIESTGQAAAGIEQKPTKKPAASASAKAAKASTVTAKASAKATGKTTGAKAAGAKKTSTKKASPKKKAPARRPTPRKQGAEPASVEAKPRGKSRTDTTS